MCWNWLRVVHSSSLCTLFPNAALQWSQVGSLKLVRAGVFMQRRLANVTNRGWFFIFLLESHLLIIYQHRPETRQESAVSLTHIQIQSERAQSFKLKQWLCFEMNSVWNENSNNWLHVRHKGIELSAILFLSLPKPQTLLLLLQKLFNRGCNSLRVAGANIV